MIDRISGDPGIPGGQAQAGKAPDKLREVAEEFEAMFVELMLKQARAANKAWGNERQGGMARETYEGWQDRDLAKAVVKGSGLGVSEMLYRQLQREQLENEK